MGFLGDLFLGARPDMRYTGEQQEIMDWGNNYGEQFNPEYGKDRRHYKKYLQGNDKGGRLTRFMRPMLAERGNMREGAVDEYNRAMAPGFNSGGGALAAAGAARLRREYDRDTGRMAGNMYVQRGEQLHDRITSAYEAAKGRELSARGIAAGVAGSGAYNNARQGGLLQSMLEKGMDLAAAYATGGMSEAGDMMGTGLLDAYGTDPGNAPWEWQ